MYMILQDGFQYKLKSDRAILVSGPTPTEISHGYYTIPEKIHGRPVLEIKDAAFMNSEIKSLKLPSCIKHIGKRAFKDSKIQEISFFECEASNILKLDSCAFDGCEHLMSFKTEQVVIAEYFSFAHCPNLTEFYAHFQCINPEAFAYSGITSIDMTDNCRIKARSLDNSQIKEIHLKNSATFAQRILEWIRQNNINVYVATGSPLLDMVHLGHTVFEE